MADYRVGSEFAEATEDHFARKREELRKARIQAIDAAHYGEERWCRIHEYERDEYWECDVCEAEKAEERTILACGRAF